MEQPRHLLGFSLTSRALVHRVGLKLAFVRDNGCGGRTDILVDVPNLI